MCLISLLGPYRRFAHDPTRKPSTSRYVFLGEQKRKEKKKDHVLYVLPFRYILNLPPTNAGPTTLHHRLVVFGETLSCPLAGLDELIDASADAGFFLGRNSLRGKVVDAVIEASMVGKVRHYFLNKQPRPRGVGNKDWEGIGTFEQVSSTSI
jgi:hypothetical protein